MLDILIVYYIMYRTQELLQKGNVWNLGQFLKGGYDEKV